MNEATAYNNIMRVLRHLGLDKTLTVYGVGVDRIYASPIGTTLEDYAKSHQWMRDPACIVERLHGGGWSYREPDGTHPAMQLVFHPVADSRIVVEIDLDESAPVDVVGALWHLKEVATNHIFNRKTDPKTIAYLLDRRFGKEEAA